METKFPKEVLIKGAAIVSDTRKYVTESVVKRFNQRFPSTVGGLSPLHLIRLRLLNAKPPAVYGLNYICM
jgi:hypothetical protein